MGKRYYDDGEWGDDYEDRKRFKKRGIREARDEARKAKMCSDLTERGYSSYDETGD